MMLLAQSDSQVMEIVKDPGFAQWVVYLLVVVIVVEKIGGGLMRLTGRSVPAQREITGKLTTAAEKQHADQGEVDEIKEELQDLKEETRAQHMQASTAAANRVAALSEVIDSRTREVEKAVAESVKGIMERVDRGFDELGKRLTDVAVQGARHDAVLAPLAERLAVLERKHSEGMKAAHDRINDAIKLAMEKKQR
jgi:Tfp pilus assembly protein PilN